MAEASKYKIAIDGEPPRYFDDWTIALSEYVALAKARREPTLYMADWSMVSVPEATVRTLEANALAKTEG